MTHTRFYNSVLTELQAGNVHDGIILLVGMLDSAGRDAAALEVAHKELTSHDLWQILLQDPLCAQATAAPGKYSALGDMICQEACPSAATSTGFRLFGVTHELTFARAFRERRRQAAEILVRSWQLGRRICLPGCSDFQALGALEGQDLSNIIVVDANPDCLAQLKARLGHSIATVNEDPLAFLRRSAAEEHRFDLVCATEMLDALDQRDLPDTFAAMRGSLAENGKILTASLLPEHLGSGWRRACLGWNIHCHDDARIEQAATAAGLSVQTYHDATDCVVWAEMKSTQIEREGNHAHGR